MTTIEWKKVARILKEAYKELEGEALSNGIDIFSDEYKQLIDKTREVILSKMGFTLEEYRIAKSEVANAKQTTVNTQIADVVKKIEELPTPIIPTTEEIKNIANEIAKEYIKPPIVTNNTTNQIVKEITHEVIIEKPITIETTRVTRETYNAKPLEKKLGRILQQLDEIKIPEQINVEQLKKELKSDFSVFFEHNINTLDMPNFRKLAMGLQGQIDALGSGSGTWGSITGTLSSQTDLQTALNLAVPYTGATGDLNLGAFGLSLGTNLTFLKEAGHTIFTADSTTADTSGGAMAILSGAGVGTGSGGAISFIAGKGGETGVGGSFDNFAGDGGLTSGDGGYFKFTAGNATSGNGGNVEFFAGFTNGGGVVGTYKFWEPLNQSYSAALDMSLIVTADRTFTFPDASGTIALQSKVFNLQGFTVATLPAGTQGDTAFCTDLLAPTFLVAATGGGAVVGPVFFNGTAWISY